MTRKQALTRAISLLSSLPSNEETEAVKKALQELYEDLPITQWDEKTIYDTIEQFFLDHGRYPNTKEFESKGLPSHPTIANRFGMTVLDFMDTFYPHRKGLVNRASKKYKDKPREHWLNVFKEQMEKHQIRTMSEYNYKKTEGPGWAYIAHLFNLRTWKELLEYSGINVPPKPTERVQFTVSRKVNRPDIDDLKKIQSRIQEHMFLDSES